ncbi:hypothetical protein D3C87_2001240 [compost metagenome]
MENHRSGGTRHGAVQVIQIAKQIAVEQTKQRDVGNRGQTWRLFQHVRIVIVADTFFAALAVAVNKAGL